MSAAQTAKTREAYPLDWPEARPRTKFRLASAFKTTFTAARDHLYQQIQAMGGKNAILSTNLELKWDGQPKASAGNPSDPGVAVYFKYKINGRETDMCFACDKYATVRENIRAIGLSIEAIRGIERWGSSDMMERAFRGFTALSEHAGEYWRDIFGFERDKKVTVDDIEVAFRRLAHVAHPDKGGNVEQWHQLVLARENARKDLGVTR